MQGLQSLGLFSLSPLITLSSQLKSLKNETRGGEAVLYLSYLHAGSLGKAIFKNVGIDTSVFTGNYSNLF